MSKFYLFASDEYDSARALGSFQGNFDTLKQAQDAIVITLKYPGATLPFLGFVKGEHDESVEWAEIATTDESGALVFLLAWFRNSNEWHPINE